MTQAAVLRNMSEGWKTSRQDRRHFRRKANRKRYPSLTCAFIGIEERPKAAPSTVCALYLVNHAIMRINRAHDSLNVRLE